MKTYYLQTKNLFEAYLEGPVWFKLTVLYRLFMAISPAMLASFLIPADKAFVTPFFVCISGVLIYWAMNPIQDEIFTYNRSFIQWRVTVPFYWLVLGWGVLLGASGRVDQMLNTESPLIMLMIVAIWPVFRSKKNMSMETRKTPLNHVYPVFFVVVVAHQLHVVSRFL